MFYLRIGLRNIIKNYRRSLITMCSIIIGMVSCLLTQGFFHWNLNKLTESGIHSGVGHYQLYADGFSKFGSDNPYQYLIKDATSILNDLRKIPEVELVTTRMSFNGILSSGQQSTVVIGEAGIPRNEIKLNSFSGLVKGSTVNSGIPNGLIIGDGVAAKLSAKIGDTLTLMGNGKDGSINAVDLDVTGIQHSGNSELDDISAFTSLGIIQNILNTDNQVQRIVILLKNTKDAPKVLPQIKSICKKYHLEFKNWEDLIEFYQTLEIMFNIVFYVIMLIVLIIVTFTISNTVNMNLNERFREIGTIRALGTRRIQVGLIFMVESWLIGIIGGFIGLLISFSLIGLNEILGGLPIMLNGAARPFHIFFHPSLSVIILCLFLFSFVAMLASILPSRRASIISISQALRWI